MFVCLLAYGKPVVTLRDAIIPRDIKSHTLTVEEDEWTSII